MLEQHPRPGYKRVHGGFGFGDGNESDGSLTPVYSFTPGRNKTFSKSFKAGKFPQATASMSPKESHSTL
ncbi:unnamed protein product [Cuscuta campestris]|uniref:Uncharacterized protein n=1 Tax=Cuscuta campestris TaxID=132261 RepID=A0A484MLN8_9ASTE|nr:unnamed protein product [Cuscuta campestris]